MNKKKWSWSLFSVYFRYNIWIKYILLFSKVHQLSLVSVWTVLWMPRFGIKFSKSETVCVVHSGHALTSAGSSTVKAWSHHRVSLCRIWQKGISRTWLFELLKVNITLILLIETLIHLFCSLLVGSSYFSEGFQTGKLRHIEVSVCSQTVSSLFSCFAFCCLFCKFVTDDEALARFEALIFSGNN